MIWKLEYLKIERPEVLETGRLKKLKNLLIFKFLWLEEKTRINHYEYDHSHAILCY